MLNLRGLSKSYGPTKALRSVDLRVEAGEILALCGENGAGKSTVVRMLSGAESPDQGAMTLEGAAFAPRSPAEARALGVATLYQELSLLPQLTVEDNLLLGIEPGRGGFIHRRTSRLMAVAALEKAGIGDLDLDAKVGGLRVGIQQRVEIARALVNKSKLLILDEPTARLSRSEAEALFLILRGLKGRGQSIIYISHFLDEVKTLADRVLVLRDGAVAGEGPMANFSVADLITAMLGRRMDELFPPRRANRAAGPAVLAAEKLSGGALPRQASFSLRPSEILGIAGLTGSGRTELLRCVYGLDPVRGGHLWAGGLDLEATPENSIGRGMGFLSEDRKSEGLALGMTAAENVTLSSLRRFGRGGILSQSREREAASKALEGIGVMTKSLDQAAGTLSGGNQQKLALARLACQGARILLLDQPTRGVDIGSRARIYSWIDGLVREGASVIMASDDLAELLGLSDRIAVMRRGVLGDSILSEDLDQESLHASILGVEQAA